MSNNELKKLIKTELRIVRLTTDSKEFLSEYEAIIHESELEEKRKHQRSWEEMKQNIADMVLEVLKKNRWVIYFINEPMQKLPVQDSLSTLYKVNEVNIDEFEQAIKLQIDTEAERNNECQENQAENTLQTDSESLNGTERISNDIEE